MQANRSRDTGPELAVRRLLHASGLRYRVHKRPLADFPRKADVVFPREQVAVFIDGCFWHACPEHGTKPRVNTEYWAPKLARNAERDRDTDLVLESSGWVVVRVWEHEEPAAAAAKIRRLVLRRRSRL